MEKGKTNLLNKLLEIHAFNSSSQSGSGSGDEFLPRISVEQELTKEDALDPVLTAKTRVEPHIETLLNDTSTGGSN